MSSSTNEDRELSETANMEESNLNTIEFLRARLLSERSVSKSARQRADELATRVAELEEQLKFISLQRKKAEKATVDVLAILENHGVSDVSEEFDSCSEQGETEEFQARNSSLMSEETSTNVKSRKNEKEAYSSSEIESSPSTGRSLSWRSTKESQHSLEKKKFMDSVRRRASFSSNSSSARRVGKSCRRVRRRDTRSMDESKNESTENGVYFRDASNCSEGEPFAVAESSGYANGKSPTNGTQKDMESALQHQAQLIGQFEEEEKAQREWEEKFRENNGGTQDSCDPGNHSDITEERYETKSPEPSSGIQTIDSNNRKKSQESAESGPTEPPQTSKSLPSVTNTVNTHLHIEKTINANESSASEFSFHMSEKSPQISPHTSQQYLPVGAHTPPNIPSYVERKTPVSASSGTPSSSELTVVPSNSLGSVLDALQHAKLSLNQKLSSSSQNAVYPSYTETSKIDSFQIPFTTPGLFRLPTDYQSNPGVQLQPNFANHPPQVRFFSEPSLESRIAFSGDPFLSIPNRPLNPEMRLGFSTQRSLSLTQPQPSEAPPLFNGTNHLDPYRNSILPPVQDSYPFLPDVTLRLPSNEQGASRSFPVSERGLPPVMRLSSYDGRMGPDTYR